MTADRGAEGTIPAGARSRWSRPPRCRVRRGHPRGRGEQVSERRPARVAVGPSPRAQGAGHGARRGRQRSGLFPRARGAAGRSGRARRVPGSILAGAGSRPRDHPPDRPPWDYPRGRGEQTVTPPAEAEAVGPFPRARGAGRPAQAEPAGVGAIPAGAGSRDADLRTEGPGGDHPAGAGSRCSQSAAVCGRWVHSRGCGEQLWSYRSRLQCPGPAPRARGAERQVRQRDLGGGTIPAGAGTSRTPNRAAGRCRDHPRECGDHLNFH